MELEKETDKDLEDNSFVVDKLALEKEEFTKKNIKDEDSTEIDSGIIKLDKPVFTEDMTPINQKADNLKLFTTKKKVFLVILFHLFN